MINLINGKLRTPKIKYLHRAIAHLNLLYNTNIEKLPLDTYRLNKPICLTKSRGRIKCTLSIKQRMIDKPTGGYYVPFMSKTADFFQCKIKYESKNVITFWLKQIVSII